MKTKFYTSILCLFTLLFVTVPATAQESRDLATNQTQSEKSITIKVTGINCGGDIIDIQKKVSELKGVTSVDPAKKPAATTVFLVKYNAALTTEKDIRNAVENTAGCSDPDSRPYKVKL